MVRFNEMELKEVFQLYLDGSYEEFEKKFNLLYKCYLISLPNQIRLKNCDLHEIMQEAYLNLFSNLKNNIEKIDSIDNLQKLIKEYALKAYYRKIYYYKKNLTEANLDLSSHKDQILIPIYLSNLNELDLTKCEGYELLALKYIDNKSYEDISIIEEYSNIKSEALRKKISRYVKKIKDQLLTKNENRYNK